MTQSWKPARALEDESYAVQAATLWEQVRHAQAATMYWQRRYAEQERRAKYFERQHNRADAQLVEYQKRDGVSK